MHNERIRPMPIHHIPAPPHVKAPPLSFGTRVGDLDFISGIPGYDEQGGLPDGFEALFAFVVMNFTHVLTEAGVTKHKHNKNNVLLTRAADVADMNGRGA